MLTAFLLIEATASVYTNDFELRLVLETELVLETKLLFEHTVLIPIFSQTECRRLSDYWSQEVSQYQHTLSIRLNSLQGHAVIKVILCTCTSRLLDMLAWCSGTGRSVSLLLETRLVLETWLLFVEMILTPGFCWRPCLCILLNIVGVCAFSPILPMLLLLLQSPASTSS